MNIVVSLVDEKKTVGQNVTDAREIATGDALLNCVLYYIVQ